MNDSAQIPKIGPDPDTFTPVAPHWYVTNTGGVLLTGVLATVTGNRWIRRLFHLAVAIHVVEAGVAYRWARRAGFHNSAPRWMLQTLAVGFPSLFALRDDRILADAIVDEKSAQLRPQP